MGAKNFRLGTRAAHWLILRVTIATGAFLNALGILLGAIFGLTQRVPLSARAQKKFKTALGVASVFFGLQLVWLHIGGTFLLCAKQIFLAALAVVIGYWTGKLLGLQKISNRLGRFAGGLISSAQKNPPGKPGDGFLAGSILFCAAPLGILGAITDGLSGNFSLLAVKGVMDALATMAFVKIFRWPAAFAAFPVFIFLVGSTLGSRLLAAHFFYSPSLIDSVNIVAGLVACIVALVIFETRKIEFANYLPALVIAPLLARFFGWN